LSACTTADGAVAAQVVVVLARAAASTIMLAAPTHTPAGNAERALKLVILERCQLGIDFGRDRGGIRALHRV